MKKNELIEFLDEYLKISDYPNDDSKNGFQVDSDRQEIKKIGYAVDATSYIFDKAIKENVDMIICHHGLFWWLDLVVVGTHHNRLTKLIKNDIALYGCHLPLDAHEEVGNNIVMLNKFVEMMRVENPEIKQDGHAFWLKFKEWIVLSDVMEIYCNGIWIIWELYNFWKKEEINSIYFDSGGWLYTAKIAKENNYDLLITWEWPHRDIVNAKEIWQSIVLWWHYETEVFGVQALAEKLNKDFGVDIVFLDEKY